MNEENKHLFFTDSTTKIINQNGIQVRELSKTWNNGAVLDSMCSGTTA
jgi:hypothetical protein